MNNKLDKLIPRWMKDSERKMLADSLTSMLTRYSDDWSVHDSQKAIDAFERWAYPLIDKERFRRQMEFERDLTFFNIPPTVFIWFKSGKGEVNLAVFCHSYILQ